MKRILWAAVLAVMAIGGGLGIARADVLISSTDFNSFALGSVNGQGGWGVTGAYFQQVVSLGGGNNVLQVNNQVTSGSFGDQVFGPRPGLFVGESSTAGSYSPVIGNRLVLSFDFMAATTVLQNDARSTFSTDDGNGGRQSFIALLGCGAGMVCLETFNVNPDGTFAGPITIATNLAGWNNIKVDVQFNDGAGNDIVTYLLNGVPIHTNTSWESFYSNFQAALHPNGVANQTLLIRQSGATCNGCSGFYIDNVTMTSVETHEVPEPATGLMFVGSLLGASLLARRRRREQLLPA